MDRYDFQTPTGLHRLSARRLVLWRQAARGQWERVAPRGLGRRRLMVLLLLVQNSGRVVAHEDLLRHLASKEALHEHIRALRTVLGDDPRVIVSRPNGYEFTPPVLVIQEVDASNEGHAFDVRLAAEHVAAQLGLPINRVAPACLVMLMAAAFGGVVWTFVWGALGGSREPRGMAAGIWFVTATGPVVCAIALVVRYWGLVPSLRNNVGRYGAFLGGGLLGAVSFYGAPSLGYGGIRPWLEQQGLPFVSVEHLLVVAWSSLIGAGSLISAARFEQPRRSLPAAAMAVAIQLAITVGLTSAAVVVTLGVFPTPAYESVRGLAAGLALRVGLSLALLVRHSDGLVDSIRPNPEP